MTNFKRRPAHVAMLLMLLCALGTASVIAQTAPNSESHETTSDGTANASNSGPLPKTLFDRIDSNHDKVIVDADLKSPQAVPYAEQLAGADTNHDGRITREEFEQIGVRPLYRDPATAAALLLALAFAGFCMFLDGCLDSDRRDYFWWSLAATLVFPALAFFVMRVWFLDESPYLAYVAVVPVIILVVAWLTGQMKEAVQPTTGPTGPVVFKVGSAKKDPKDAAGPAKGTTRQTPPSRRPTPQRTPRPAPLPRPPVPERRPPPRPPNPPPPSSGGARPPGQS